MPILIVEGLELIRDKRYYFLWIAQFFSTLGDWAYYFVISLFIFESTKQNITLGVLTITYTLPAIILAPIAGVLADKFSRKKIMIITDIARAIIIFVFPFSKNLLLIYFLVFIEQSFTVLFSPAAQAFIPQIVEGEDKLLKANSWLSGGRSIARVLGSAIGGFFYMKLGIKSVFWLDSLTFIISILCVLNIKVKEEKFVGDGTFKLPKLLDLKEFSEGFKMSNSNLSIRYLLYNYAAVMLIWSLISTFLVTYSKEVLNSGGNAFSLLMSVQSVGAIAGSLLIPIVLKGFSKVNLVRVSQASLVFYCAIPISIILFPKIAIVSVLLLLFGAVEISLGIIFQTTVQSELPNQWQGRIFSIQGAIFSFAYLAGAMGGGLLIDLFNIQKVFVIAGIIFAQLAILLICLFERKRRREYAEVMQQSF